MGMDTITLTRPEAAEELRLEAESRATAGVLAYTGDTGDGTTWCVREDPAVGKILILRRGDYCLTGYPPELSGDTDEDLKRVALRWASIERRLTLGMAAQ
jgi:hypothetical protein